MVTSSLITFLIVQKDNQKITFYCQFEVHMEHVNYRAPSIITTFNCQFEVNMEHVNYHAPSILAQFEVVAIDMSVIGQDIVMLSQVTGRNIFATQSTLAKM